MAEPLIVEATNRAAWRRWLEGHRDRGRGVWLVIHKRGSTGGSLTYDDAVAEALCFGWIDSKANTLDDERYKLWMAPRKPKSAWSAVNKRRVDELVGSGRMTEAGLATIDAAKADGSWNALDRSDALELPDDLLSAFDRHAGSRGHWDGFPPGARKQILEWIYAAKRDETRAKRIEVTASLAAKNERANQLRPKR
ncbi:MAG: YdeI/OmpD-associated family protein [Actinomycetota bacterium]